KEPERPPPAPQAVAGSKTFTAFVAIKRTSSLDSKEYIDRWRTADDKEAQVRKLAQLSQDLQKRFAPEGGDEVYIGTASGEMHLAHEAIGNMNPADAMTAQREALRKLYPNAPIDKIFSKPEDAWFS